MFDCRPRYHTQIDILHNEAASKVKPARLENLLAHILIYFGPSHAYRRGPFMTTLLDLAIRYSFPLYHT